MSYSSESQVHPGLGRNCWEGVLIHTNAPSTPPMSRRAHRRPLCAIRDGSTTQSSSREAGAIASNPPLLPPLRRTMQQRPSDWMTHTTIRDRLTRLLQQHLRHPPQLGQVQTGQMGQTHHHPRHHQTHQRSHRRRFQNSRSRKSIPRFLLYRSREGLCSQVSTRRLSFEIRRLLQLSRR